MILIMNILLNILNINGLIFNLSLALVVFGCIGINMIIRLLKRAKEKPWFSSKKQIIKLISYILISVSTFTFGLYWLLDGFVFEDTNYSFTIEKAIDEYGDFVDYQLVARIDTKFSLDPLFVIKKNDNELSICSVKTRKMLIGLKKFWVRGSNLLVDNTESCDYKIDENRIYGGYPENFPDIRFGIIYPDKRDTIRVNGKTPEFYEINFCDTDYVIWYIKKDKKIQI